jgi:hypothetical protein
MGPPYQVGRRLGCGVAPRHLRVMPSERLPEPLSARQAALAPEQHDLPQQGRPLKLQDLPTVAASIVEEFGAVLLALYRSAQATIAPVSRAVVQTIVDVVGRLNESAALDYVAEVLDRGLLWAGSPEGREALEKIDTALLGVRTAEFYGRVGLYRPLAPLFLRDAMERSMYHGPHDLRALLADAGPDSENWKWITEGLLATPCLKDRAGCVRASRAPRRAGDHDRGPNRRHRTHSTLRPSSRILGSSAMTSQKRCP